MSEDRFIYFAWFFSCLRWESKCGPLVPSWLGAKVSGPFQSEFFLGNLSITADIASSTFLSPFSFWHSNDLILSFLSPHRSYLFFYIFLSLSFLLLFGSWSKFTNLVLNCSTLLFVLAMFFLFKPLYFLWLRLMHSYFFIFSCSWFILLMFSLFSMINWLILNSLSVIIFLLLIEVVIQYILFLENN